MNKIAMMFTTLAISGCASEHHTPLPPDYYSWEYDIIVIYSSNDLHNAQVKADKYCHGSAFAIPELRDNDVKTFETPGFHFACHKMEALRVRGEYGDKASKAEYVQLSKIEAQERDKKAAVEYAKEREQLRKAAKAPGLHSVTKRNYDGSYSTTSYGNGIICETTVGENGGSSSCDDADDY